MKQSIALTATIVIAVGLGSWAGYSHKLDLPVTIRTSPTPEASATPTATPEPTAGWQTYTNTENGFSFQYPAGWRVTEEGNTVFLDNGVDNPNNIEVDPRWIQFQIRLPSETTNSATVSFDQKQYGTVQGWELTSNDFGGDVLSVKLQLAADSYLSLGIYGAFAANRTAVDAVLATFKSTR